MRTVRQANPFPAYYGVGPRVVEARDGTFRTVGAGYAGRIRWSTIERASRAIEKNAQFMGWADKRVCNADGYHETPEAAALVANLNAALPA